MPDRLSDAELLVAWDIGSARGPIDRALLLLWAAGDRERDLATIPLAERDRDLLRLRAASFGDRMDCLAACPSCGTGVEVATSAEALAAALPEATATELRIGPHRIALSPLDSADLAAAAGCTAVADAEALLFERSCRRRPAGPRSRGSAAPCRCRRGPGGSRRTRARHGMSRLRQHLDRGPRRGPLRLGGDRSRRAAPDGGGRRTGPCVPLVRGGGARPRPAPPPCLSCAGEGNVTGPLARLAARALGAPAPMTGIPAAAIRPRLPARFETEAEPAPPADDLVGTPEPVLQRTGPDPSLQTRAVRATDRAGTPDRPTPSASLETTAALSRRLPPPAQGSPPAPLQPPSLSPSLRAAPTTETGRPGPMQKEPATDPSDDGPITARAGGAPLVAPPPPPQVASPTPPAPLQPVREPPPFRPAPVPTLPDRQPSDRPRAQTEAPPDIVIHIGRIDVAAPAAPPAGSPRPAPPAQRTTDLGDYLRGRGSRP
jgi:hypothetical protein